ncbi:MAG: GNAT family N-acetyltransferase [Eubacteriales bacterium]
MVEYTKATTKDYDELLRMSNEVFSTGPDCGFFQNLLPKLYAPYIDTTDSHYIVREDGKIVSAVGAYENTVNVGGEELRIRGIGMVSVLKDYRRKGYMVELMKRAMADMKRDGIAFSFLGGMRQRYEYFSFTQSGMAGSFDIIIGNMRHTYSPDASFGYTFENLKKDDNAALDLIYRLYMSKPLRAGRSREALFDILVSWSMRPVVIYKDGALAGYLVTDSDGGSITEFELVKGCEIGHMINDYMKQNEKESINIRQIPLCETDKINFLTLHAEGFNMTTCENMSVLDYKTTLGAFMRLKASYSLLADGELSIDIADMGRVKIKVADNKVTVENYDGTADVSMSHLTAMQVLFSCGGAMGTFDVSLPAFARSWFPLPLFLGNPDGV